MLLIFPLLTMHFAVIIMKHIAVVFLEALMPSTNHFRLKED